MKPLTFTGFLMALCLAGVYGIKNHCHSGMKNIFNSPLIFCYALVDTSKGLLTYEQARNECAAIDSSAIPLVVGSKDHLGDATRFAIDEGLPTGKKAGFWLGITRDVSAPLEANGTLSAENASIRTNRNLFHFTINGTTYPADPSLWRTDNQPGDRTDQRDEMCTAQKKPGDPNFLGIDDYPCEGYQLHYAVCVAV